MINFYINKIFYKIPKNLTILQACIFVGIHVPHFCYSSRLVIAGNCRVCLVEVIGGAKPMLACVTLATDNLEVYTKSPLVQKVRESVLEFLLLNHPLDCPICDQGGECDLQDQSLKYGSGKNRFYKGKGSTSDKLISPVIVSVMTRCIHCSRCVRFSTNFSGMPFLGLLGRGKYLEIGSYVNKVFKSELAGNVIDLCPVGAFTSKHYSFRGRPWELKSFNLIDFFDVFGGLVNVSFKKNEILRILPLKSREVEVSWISDRTRFSYDSYKLQRIVSPMVKKKNQFVKKTWKKTFSIIKNFMIKGSVTGIIGEGVDLETIFVFKKLLNFLGSSNILLENTLLDKSINQNLKKNYLFNRNVLAVTDLILIVNLNVRFESTSLNLKIKECLYKNFNILIYYIGKPIDLTYPVEQIGWNLNIFLSILEGKHKISGLLYRSVKPIILLEPWVYNKLGTGFSFLNLNFFEINSYEVGVSQGIDKNTLITRSKVLFLLNANSINLKRYKQKFILFLGYQGGYNTTKSFVILPGLSLFEKNSRSISNLGLLVKFKKLFIRYKLSKEDYKVLNSLNIYLNSYNILYSSTITNLVLKEVPRFSRKFFGLFEGVGRHKVKNYFFENRIRSFFLSSNFYRMSPSMKIYSKAIKIEKNSFRELKLKN